MKKLILILATFVAFSCSEQNLSPEQTAKIVVESFYNNDSKILKKHTTIEGFNGMKSIQNLIGEPTAATSDFKVIQQETKDDVAWVKFKTNYSDKPETFKLVMEGGQWKVDRIKLREVRPF